MIKSTRPKLNRFKYAAMPLGALAVVAFSAAGFTPVATAEPGTWDIEAYDTCAKNANTGTDLNIFEERLKWCCWDSDGVWDYAHNKCVAPPAEPAKGSRQLPGNVHLPSDIVEPGVTKAPLRPIRVPTDTATAVSQTPA
jgi:hypothetical protein